MWDRVHFKLGSAEFFLGEMGRDLIPPSARPESQHLAAIAISTGTIVDHPWQPKFYYHLDAFLAATRSVPDVIQACFGNDNGRLAGWVSKLDPDEQKRRNNFQTAFKPLYWEFQGMPLSRARVGTYHHRGVPPVEAKVQGKFGVDHVGGPLTRLASMDTTLFGAGKGSTPLWLGEYPPFPIEPRTDDFYLQMADGTVRKLFPECTQHLQECHVLLDKARAISEAVHGGKNLTLPPTD